MFAKLIAIKIEPIPVIIQAIIAVLGLVHVAKFCGDMKIPDAIILPTTIPIAAGSPSSLLNPAFSFSV